MANNDKRKLPPREWEPYFRKANLRVDELNACKGARPKAIRIGQFLSPMVGRTVPITGKDSAGNDRNGTATLRVEKAGANERRYFFEVTWDESADGTAANGDGASTSQTADALRETGVEMPATASSMTTSATPKALTGMPAAVAAVSIEATVAPTLVVESQAKNTVANKTPARTTNGAAQGNNEDW